MEGNVFDIRRFSTHDGDGIRTTVFMKGCPLQCVWCQNPEGIDRRILPIRMEKTCIGCKRCVSLSKNGGAYLKNGRVEIDRKKKEDWERMAEECPSGALRMDAKAYSSRALLEELLKDLVFFRHGGGVTFSGGEPLMQADFVTELLKMLRERNIHTAIETSLFAPAEALLKAVPHLDCIYADMKIFEDGNHRRFVGASNAVIKENLEILLKSAHRDRVIIRTPLIPTFTATEENLSQIAEFLTGVYPEVSYELLNYNPLAEAKYHFTDREFCFKENPGLYTREQMLSFGEIVKAHGIKNLIMEI